MTVVVMASVLLIGVILNYYIPKNVFLIIASIATFATVWVWLMILISQIGMRRKLSKEEVKALDFPVIGWPYAPAFAVVFLVFVLIIIGYFPDSRPAIYVGGIWLIILGLVYYFKIKPNQRLLSQHQEERRTSVDE